MMQHNHVVDSYSGSKTAIMITLYALLANTECVFMRVSAGRGAEQDGGKKEAYSGQAAGVGMCSFVLRYLYHGKCFACMMGNVGGHFNILQSTSAANQPSFRKPSPVQYSILSVK